MRDKENFGERPGATCMCKRVMRDNWERHLKNETQVVGKIKRFYKL